MKRVFLLLGASLLITSCDSDDSTKTPVVDNNYSQVLTNIATDVITETYEDLNDKSADLIEEVNEFKNNRSQEQLKEVREAWVKARAPWEKSEGFLFGPVDSEGLDPAMDTWPVDVNSMNAILNSNTDITANLLSTNNEARGFHLIEYLLWDLNGDKSANSFTDREIEYLKAAAQDLNNNTQQLYDGWKSSGGNYQANFINAGKDGSVYTSQKNAIIELIDGMITIADEVANGKIADPLNEGGDAQPDLEESRFSNNSKIDFVNNIRSIENVYLGDYDDKDGAGITDIVSINNSDLDAKVKKSITDAMNAIDAIPGSFTDAITNHRNEVVNAKTKVGELLNVLEADLKPYLQSL